jgi:dTDP-glucose 4,6-dehydratase
MRVRTCSSTKMKVLITGGLGFIFSHVTQYLVSKGYEVIVFDAELVGSHPEIIDGSFKYEKVDISEPSATILMAAYQPDYIIHAAAISDVDFSIENPEWTIRKNNQGTLNVFEAARMCKNLKKLVYVSTDEIYGECDYLKEEEDIIFPKNPYACSKAFGSLLRITYDNTYPELKDKTAETRFCNVFGERQDERKILGRLKKSLATGEPITIHNGGTGYREYIYVHNIPPVVEKIMLEGDRVYNVTLNDGFTVNDLVKRVEKITGKEFNKVEGNRAGMDLKYQMSNKRILELGWKPDYSFDKAITKYFNA